jgi:hypothetical protein
MNSSLYHKIIYSSNRIFPLVQKQSAKIEELNKWMNGRLRDLAKKNTAKA